MSVCNRHPFPNYLNILSDFRWIKCNIEYNSLTVLLFLFYYFRKHFDVSPVAGECKYKLKDK